MTQLRPVGRILFAMAIVVGAWILATPPSGGADEPSHVIRSAALIRGELDGERVTASLVGFELPAHIGAPDPACFALQPAVPASCITELEAGSGTQLKITKASDYPIWGHLAPGLGSLLPQGWSSPGARAASAAMPLLLLAGALFAASRHGWWSAAGVLVAITVPVWFSVAVVNPSSLVIAGGVAVWVAFAGAWRRTPGLGWAPSRLDQVLLAAGWVAMVLPRRDGLVYAAVVAALAIVIFDVGIGHLRRSIARSTWVTIVVSTLATLAWASRHDSSASKLLFVAPFVPVAAIGLRWLWRRAAAPEQRLAVIVGVGSATLAGSYVVMGTRGGGFDGAVFQRTINQTGIDIREAIGIVGWLDTAVPQSMVFVWLIGLGLVVAGAIIAESRQAAIGAAAILTTGIWMSWVLTMVQNDASGTYWQGRYYLPLLVGIPIVLTTASIDPRQAARLGKAAAALSLVVANVAIAAAVRRWGVGDQGTLAAWKWDTYATVVPPVVLVALHGAGTLLLWRSIDLVAGPADASSAAVSTSDSGRDRHTARDIARDRAAAAPTLVEGVNLLGYHRAASGLGVAVRRIHAGLVAAGVPVSLYNVELTDSPLSGTGAGDGIEACGRPLRRTTIAVVTAPELPAALVATPQLRTADRVIGYWFWEVDHVPDGHAIAFDLVDEIWAPTTFVADAYRRAPNGPAVAHQPMYLARPYLDPDTHRAWRQRLAPNDEFVFVVALDLFSIVERKNPFGAIDAFAAAFGSTDANVRLVIKTLNGDKRTASLGRITRHVANSGMSERIEVLDEFLSDSDMAAMVAAADCLVSLHRGEGLGLHLADAMWLHTAVLASRYSGNLDFMDSESAALIDVVMIAVENGEGAYPDGLQWADPDIGDAAAWMRRLVDEPTTRTQMIERAYRRMQDQPSEKQRGQQYAEALNRHVARVEPTVPSTVTV
ncbi:MAG: glycosyltransferase involved in cell wall biosynthesis [Ilumatobacter sp.]